MLPDLFPGMAAPGRKPQITATRAGPVAATARPHSRRPPPRAPSPRPGSKTTPCRRPPTTRSGRQRRHAGDCRTDPPGGSEPGKRYTNMRSIRFRPRRYRWLGAVATAVILAVGTGTAVQASTSASHAPSQVACAAGTNVQTTTGPVCGITVNGVNEWLGIPYAAPPVGALRWQPPRPHAPWTTTLQATAFGNECLVPSPDRGGVAPATGSSEDCLYVNVWAPAGVAAGHNLPVMVHIHGGGSSRATAMPTTRCWQPRATK